MKETNSKSPTMIILSGIPGIGKSTYAATLGIKIICADQCRKILTGNESDMSRDDYVWGHLLPEQIKVAFGNREDCLFDSTACNIKRRKEIMKMGKRWGYTNFECHFIEPNLEVALKQNLMRERKVPEEVIRNFAKKWEVPTLEEGFSRILNLTIGEEFRRI